MSGPLLRIENLTKRFGGILANDGIELDVRMGEVHAVIGPNGAGKTTLISLLVGERRPDTGGIFLDGADITRLSVNERAQLGIARSFQITSVFPDLTVIENVMLAVQAQAGHSFRFWRPARGIERLRRPAIEALDRVGLRSRADSVAAVISHGERRQLEIAMALAVRPKLLLLDEPTAGMSADESAQMVMLLQGLKGGNAMLLIEHDMNVVFSLADRITVLVNGRVIVTGAPDAVRGNPEVRRAYLG